MGRTRWLDGMKKGDWTAEEDRKLVAYINEHGIGDWGSMPKRAGLQRCGKSCRLRWLNYLRPGIKRGKFSPQEEEEIIKFHALLGNRWAAIAKQMPNRTDNDIKNHWNSCLKKRLVRKGIDPMTHEPIILITVKATSSSTTLSLSPTPIPSSSSTGSARLLNKLSAGISSRKHGLDTIKTIVFSKQPRQAVEEKIIISKEEEEVLMEIDKKVISTTSFDELPCYSTTTIGFVAYDDFSGTDAQGPYPSDFYDETDLLDLFFR